MLLNAHTALVGPGVILVPYRPEHVPKYHQWMTDPALLEATASEPLTLREEYAMQQSWQNDEDKLTFIILARPDDNQEGDITVEQIKQCPMVGDVNLFLTPGPRGRLAEVEVMVAEPAYRHRSVGHSALNLLLSYATSSEGPLHLAPYNFFVKIAAINKPSITLFQKLGFDQRGPLNSFNEVEMWAGRVSWDADYDPIDWP